jgi:hypothetical protein
VWEKQDKLRTCCKTVLIDARKMMVKMKLTETQINVARLIAMGISFDDIAEEFEINRSTIYRWRKLDYFNDEISRLVNIAKAQSGDRIIRDIDEIKDIVLSTLIDVAQCDSSGSARVSAAKVLSDMIETAEHRINISDVMQDQSGEIKRLLQQIQSDQLSTQSG